MTEHIDKDLPNEVRQFVSDWDSYGLHDGNVYYDIISVLVELSKADLIAFNLKCEDCPTFDELVRIEQQMEESDDDDDQQDTKAGFLHNVSDYKR